jgi:Ca-activated chloride channel family protein
MAAEIGPDIMPKQGDNLVDALDLAERTLGEARGSILVMVDNVASDDRPRLVTFREQTRSAIHILALARTGTPELKAIDQAANSLGASVTLMTPDSADINKLIRDTAEAPVSVSSAEDGTRWAEAGWWLVPVLAVFVLVSFRREERVAAREVPA